MGTGRATVPAKPSEFWSSRADDQLHERGDCGRKANSRRGLRLGRRDLLYPCRLMNGGQHREGGASNSSSMRRTAWRRSLNDVTRRDRSRMNVLDQYGNAEARELTYRGRGRHADHIRKDEPGPLTSAHGRSRCDRWCPSPSPSRSDMVGSTGSIPLASRPQPC